MTEMAMLDLDTLDMAGLCAALEDNSYESSWWLDSRTGEVRSHYSDDEHESVDDLDHAGLVIEPIGSHDAYRDMEMFIAQVPDRRAADLLDRAIAGRGAFRRFKDTLFEFPELRERWFAYHDARMRRRAIQWLADEELISPDVAERHRAEYPEPVVSAGLVDVNRLVRDVAEDLRMLYGDRLAQVSVFGSQARGDAGSDSDVDLLVVLSDLANAWEELRRMDEVLWRHTERSGGHRLGTAGEPRGLPPADFAGVDPGEGRSGTGHVSERSELPIGNSSPLLARSREELDAARLLAEGGCAAQAVSRSYCAAFYAAEAALLDLGETRSKHSGVVSAFVRLVIQERGLDPVAGRLLRSLFDRRGQADYSADPVPEPEAGVAISDATAVVDAVEAWLATRAR